MSILLEAKNVSAQVFGVTLLSDINLVLGAGEIVAIIGPNGAGKTSLIRALSDDLTVSGSVNLGGKAIAAYEAAERARQLAVLQQQNILDFPFLAQDVVAMGRIPHSSGCDIDTQIVQAALAEMDITYLAKRLYTRLSGGEQQRVHLARVMAQLWRSEDAPQRLLILDEPTASLDVAHAQQLMQALRRFAASGVGVVMIVHDFNIAARYSDRVVALSGGSIVAAGSPQQVINSDNIQRIFGVNATVVPHPKTACPMVFIDD